MATKDFIHSLQTLKTDSQAESLMRDTGTWELRYTKTLELSNYTLHVRAKVRIGTLNKHMSRAILCSHRYYFIRRRLHLSHLIHSLVANTWLN